MSRKGAFLKEVQNFDELGGQKMVIPQFIFSNGKVRPLEGTCRGYGAVSGEEAKSEFTLGIYTETGHYYNILVDKRVKCHIPMFFIGDKPFHLAIIRCFTMGMGLPIIDPATGIMKSPEEIAEMGKSLKRRSRIEDKG